MSTAISATLIAEQLERFLTTEARRLTDEGIEAHASLLRGTHNATLGLEIFGQREDAELTIELIEDRRGVLMDAAIIAGSGRRLASFEPVIVTGRQAGRDALGFAGVASRMLEEHFSFAPA